MLFETLSWVKVNYYQMALVHTWATTATRFGYYLQSTSGALTRTKRHIEHWHIALSVVNGEMHNTSIPFFFFNRRYNPWWVLAC